MQRHRARRPRPRVDLKFGGGLPHAHAPRQSRPNPFSQLLRDRWPGVVDAVGLTGNGSVIAVGVEKTGLATQQPDDLI
jgi:hypothetical protein